MTVTQKSCDDRHRSTRWTIRTILAIVVLISTGIVWSLLAAYGATTQAGNARQAIEVHAAGEEARDNAIRESLTRIEIEQRRQRELLDELLQARGE